MEWSRKHALRETLKISPRGRNLKNSQIEKKLGMGLLNSPAALAAARGEGAKGPPQVLVVYGWIKWEKGRGQSRKPRRLMGRTPQVPFQQQGSPGEADSGKRPPPGYTPALSLSPAPQVLSPCLFSPASPET